MSPPTAPPAVRIIHSGQGCNVEEEGYSERVFTIREGGTLELQCLVTGHPRPQVRTHSQTHILGTFTLARFGRDGLWAFTQVYHLSTFFDDGPSELKVSR